MLSRTRLKHRGPPRGVIARLHAYSVSGSSRWLLARCPSSQWTPPRRTRRPRPTYASAMSELEESLVRVYLGSFPCDSYEPCCGPRCNFVADRSHAWVIDGEIYVLSLCAGCLDNAISALEKRPRRSRIVAFEAPRDRLAPSMTARGLTTRISTAYPHGALSRRCVSCGAEPNKPCTTDGGHARHEPHDLRRDKACLGEGAT